MKAIQFTTEELNTLKTALQYVHDRKLDMIRINRAILTEDEVNYIYEQSAIYFNLIDKLK